MGMLERRQYPRIEISLPATVRTAGGETIHTKAVNIAHGGVELACDNPTALKLVPALHLANPSQTPPVDLRLPLTMADGEEPDLKCRGAIVSLRRLSQDDYRIALQFQELAEEMQKHLYAFLEECIHAA